ncbi:ABC transporter permease subunit, partial [Microbacterium aurum]
ELTEAGMTDGANGWQRFWHITLPHCTRRCSPSSRWASSDCQVFHQIYTGTQGGPAKTTMTPAYLSYTAAFQNQNWGIGAAIAFILFLIIIVFTLFQRWVLRDRPVSRRRIRAYQPKGVRS